MHALMPLAEGFEETEAITVVDILRRAQWTVVMAGLQADLVTGGHGIAVRCDTTWDRVAPAEFDVLILPGGSAGVQRLRADVRVIVAVRDFARQRKWLAAICAGPLVLHDAGVLAGRSGTCYPGVETDIPELRCARAAVVVDDRIITSQALGTSVAFALRIVAELDSPAKAAKLARSMVVKSKFSI